MEKYLILDMGKVLVGPTTGSWLITPVLLENIDVSKIDKEKMNAAMKKCSYILNDKAETLEEEYKILRHFYASLFEEAGYDIGDDIIDLITSDFVYNDTDTKYFVYDDVKEELERLSKEYTLLVLSDNWPCGDEYLKKHDLFKYFTKTYMSSVYGVTKSDGTLFDYPIKDFNIQNGDAIFVDDKEKLLDIATTKGLDVMLMDRDDSAKNSKYKVIKSLRDIKPRELMEHEEK